MSVNKFTSCNSSYKDLYNPSLLSCSYIWHYTVKKEVYIAHQIRCADEVSIRTPFLECTAHQICG